LYQQTLKLYHLNLINVERLQSRPGTLLVRSLSNLSDWLKELQKVRKDQEEGGQGQGGQGKQVFLQEWEH